jgi:hypothetical protein
LLNLPYNAEMGKLSKLYFEVKYPQPGSQQHYSKEQTPQRPLRKIPIGGY